jgi:transposase
VTRKWGYTEDENATIRRMIKEGATYREIAKALGRSVAAVQIQAYRKLGLSTRENYFKRRGSYCSRTTIRRIFDLYETRTRAEVAELTGLSISQVSHALDVAYKKHGYKTKDQRRHDSWTSDELITLLQYSGLQERGWIAQKLNRGTMQSVKECLGRMSSSSRYLNGLPQKLAEELLKVPLDAVKTAAGAPGPNGNCKTKIVPWVVMAAVIRKQKLKLAPAVEAGIVALSKFQMRVHGCRSEFETAFKVAARATEV